MDTVVITISALLGAATFMLGRSCIITERLRRLNEKNSKIIHNLRCDKEENDRECSALATTLVSLQNPFNTADRSFRVRELFEGCFLVYMDVRLYGRKPSDTQTVTIPVKSFCDKDDPEFARNEAEEFKDKCEEETACGSE